MVSPPVRVIATRGYERGAARLLTREARMAAEAEIVARPEAWPVIAGTGGARKAGSRCRDGASGAGRG
jgi:hypothetical protein